MTTTQLLPPGVRGHVTPAFEPAADTFGKLVTRGRGGGALVVRVAGETVLDLCTGSPATRTTSAPPPRPRVTSFPKASAAGSNAGVTWPRTPGGRSWVVVTGSP